MVESNKKSATDVDLNYDYKAFKNVLKNAKKGQVVTRFPPEPSGFLHIGHCKAAMLNYHYAKMNEGKMILRFDDTNPLNEKMEFVENIPRDLKTLGITPDEITYSSDHFDKIADLCRKLIKDGNAYADDTDKETMQEERMAMIESKYREATPAQNLERFEGMLKGKFVEKEITGPDGKKQKVKTQFCIRARMNMKDKVGCLRDPVFYRCKDDPHHRTKDKYKAYPTYDLTCPIVDSIEGVTHALRTTEYIDRNALYHWVLKKLELRTDIEIYNFSSLNLKYTVLSKRKLRWFVQEGHVDGWNDPRFPTVQGIMRRGMTAQALGDFMLEQGPSQKNNLMEWDKIWSLNAKNLDLKVGRYAGIRKDTAVKLTVTNAPNKPVAVMHPLHPKDATLGMKPVMQGKNCLIERSDAELIKEGDKVTLMKWGNVNITKKTVKGDQIELEGTYDKDDQSFKGTAKLSWICHDKATTCEVQMVEFDHIITKEKIEEGDEVKDIRNPSSRFEYTVIAEGVVRNLPAGAHFQFERRGYYFVDQISLKNKPMIVNFIPDGKVKAMSGQKTEVDAEKLAGKTGKTPVAKEIIPAGEDGKLSKKQLAKLAKKDKKAAIKAGDVPPEDPNRPKGPPAGGKPAAGGKAAAAAPKQQFLTIPTPVSYFGGRLADFWEEILEDQQWLLGGNSPSKAESEALKHLDGKYPNPNLYPNLFAWHTMAGRFSAKKQEAWPEGKCPMPENYVAPPKAAPAAPAKAAPAAPAEEKKAPVQEEKKEAAPAQGKKGKAAPAPAKGAAAASSGDPLLDVYKLCDLRVGKIVECEKHPDSDKLYIEKIDLGEGRIRTIGSGLQQHCTMEQMLEGQCVVFANLKPKKLGGVPSEGMVLCASDGTKTELMRPPAGCAIGERIQLDGTPIDGAPLPQESAAVLNPKKKVEGKLLDVLKTNGKKEGCFNGIRLLTSKGPIKSATLGNASVQ